MCSSHGMAVLQAAGSWPTQKNAANAMTIIATGTKARRACFIAEECARPRSFARAELT